MTFVGKTPLRKEGREKVEGRAQYIDDLHFPNMIYGATIRSTRPRARIKQIHFEGAIPWQEFVIVTAKDIPAKNYVALILYDQPYLADGVVNHPDEPILLIAHKDKYLLEQARKNIRVEYEELPAVLNLHDSMAKKNIVWGEDNILKSYHVEKGDVDGAWKDAALIVEGEYSTGAQEQLYIENNGMIAVANSNEGVTVWGSLQCPYYVHKALVALFGYSEDKIRVIQTTTGGGFGGKEEYPSMIAGHAALLALKAGVPVKLIYDRAEDLAATTKRHPSYTKHKTAFDKDGKLMAMDIDFTLDGGAYATLSAVVLSRGTLHSSGPYFSPNIRIRSRAVATNTPPNGAFRGFGAPQSCFAIERHMDVCAEKLGISPTEIRRRNFIRDGQKTATGQVIRDGVDMNLILDKALRELEYDKKIQTYAAENSQNKFLKRGVGFSSFFHGAGFTGSGERTLGSIAAVGATRDGRVQVYASSTEIGQGANTIFSQIASSALGISYEKIDVIQPDTKRVPNSGPTVASRTTMVVGGLVEKASGNLKHTLQQAGFLGESYSEIEFTKACEKYCSEFGELKIFAQYQQPPHIQWDDKTYQGDAYGTFAWAVYAADVSVDMISYQVTVNDYVAVQEIGRVVHPTLAAGQIEGGVVQGIGFAIYEKCVYQDGAMKNNQLTNYIIPTTKDVPRVRVFFEEKPYQYGPSGAKGIGELPLDGSAPAVINAIANALGKGAENSKISSIPMLPEDVMKRVEAPL